MIFLPLILTFAGAAILDVSDMRVTGVTTLVLGALGIIGSIASYLERR